MGVMNTENLSLLAFVPIVICMMAIPMFDLDFTLKMVILGIIICNSLIISIFLNSQESKEERNRKNLQLLVAMSISLMVFLFQFFQTGY
jgi:ABC-type tungstate transport system substrate-binding protein